MIWSGGKLTHWFNDVYDIIVRLLDSDMDASGISMSDYLK